jgi:enamine deaminase RidA (YjgF/YER057c/UK114 family)
MAERTSIQTGTTWEPIVGYSRAVRVGPFIYVTGTTATDERGELVGVNDPAAQMRQVLANLRSALERVGARFEDVVRTRIFTTDISQWEVIGRVHGEAFGHIRPATTMVEVRRLIEPRMVVEVEADAVIASEVK